MFNKIKYILLNLYGDWGLGIGDWAQSPIPKPQAPNPNPHKFNNIYFILLNINYLLKIQFY